MYDCVCKKGADFSGVCDPAPLPPISATHPATQKNQSPGKELQPEEEHAPRYRGRRFGLG